MNKKIFMALLALSLASIFCTTQPATNPPATVDVNASVNATLTVMAQQTEAAMPQTGAISGHLSYPSEFIPPMRVVAFDAADLTVYYFVDTALR